jgi:dihydrofolate reductase
MSGDGISVAAVVAVARNGVIGNDNKLPWHLPADLKYFRAVTMGKPIIMGRKTFASIGRPLPGRDNIVITRDPDWQAEGLTVVHSPEAAIERAKDLARARGVEEVMIIGGTEIYLQSLALTDRIYMTKVDLAPVGDSHFPDLAPEVWTESAREDHAAEGEHPAYSFVIFDRA